MQNKGYNDNVFINCPFDDAYEPLFKAIIFAVFDCGFRARCVLEEADASQIRIEKIYNIILNCRYGIHDISRTELDPKSNLPRFNMPLELGLFLGAKRFGIEDQKRKACIILDTEQYRYQEFISDISGQDPLAHGNDVEKLVKIVRNWLRDASGRVTIPGGAIIWKRHRTFFAELPHICEELNLDVDDLTFNDYAQLVTQWLETNDLLSK